MIYTNYDESSMLHVHTKFHLIGPLIPERLLRILPYMGIAAILVMKPEPFIQNLVPLSEGCYT